MIHLVRSLENIKNITKTFPIKNPMKEKVSFSSKIKTVGWLFDCCSFVGSNFSDLSKSTFSLTFLTFSKLDYS